MITINLLVNGQARRRTVRPILNGVCLVATCAALAADWWYLRESRTALLAQSVALDRELAEVHDLSDAPRPGAQAADSSSSPS